jgi:pyruvate/oxaloacetate carboxyltransferase
MNHLTVRQAGAAHHIAAVSAGKKTLSIATQSFANQMSHAFAETLSKVRSDPNSEKQTIADTASQTHMTDDAGHPR